MTGTQGWNGPTRSAVAEHYDGRAATYDENRLHLGLTEAVADWIDDRGETDVVDVATGTGLMLRSLRERRPTLRTTGVDISVGMLTVAREALPSGSFLQADATTLPLRDGTVDLVTCITALHLVPDAPRVIAECARVLRPGGRLVTATFAELTTGGRRQPTFRPDHDSYRTPELMSSLIRPHGLAGEAHREWAFEENYFSARLLLFRAVLDQHGSNQPESGT